MSDKHVLSSFQSCRQLPLQTDGAGRGVSDGGIADSW